MSIEIGSSRNLNPSPGMVETLGNIPADTLGFIVETDIDTFAEDLYFGKVSIIETLPAANGTDLSVVTIQYILTTRRFLVFLPPPSGTNPRVQLYWRRQTFVASLTSKLYWVRPTAPP